MVYMGELPLKVALAVSLLILTILIIYPLILIIALGSTQVTSALSVGSFLESIEITVIMSTLSALVAIIMGTPLAYLLARYRFRFKQLLDSIIDIPIMIPHVIVGIMIVLAFASKYSALFNSLNTVILHLRAFNSTLLHYGLLHVLLSPMVDALIYALSTVVGIKFINTLWGAVAAVAFLSSTYYIRVTEAAVSMVNPEMEIVARTLGASPSRVFISITLPKVWRAMANGALLSWARSVSEAGALFIVAYSIYFNGKYIYPASVYIYESYVGIGLSNAVKYSAALLVVVLVIFIVYRVILNIRRGD
ncbi:ABC transporter permease [Caldivirga maquilingensis]|uniref:Binding-protein-dependent transport systems inner membrane component n=1 Tax=Caldivirga maquilingensis (strain ATCC 700844 / DSM 13496 / JCM 10307 / IC-167) TaxID=397948 RepID=A8MC45_CALMQ|nr:ABC transporter permease [Caldivirga maquilingensis]ABW01351.1 binding-protein-dependent transport systems inner membrane component [Caldivirga maquilingensis IC-167]